MLKISIIILFFCNPVYVFSQELDSKYPLSIIYLEFNQELNKEIRNFFKKDIPKKSKNIPVHISDEIAFIDIEPFKDEISTISQFPISLDVLTVRSAFKNQYKFEPFKNEVMTDLLPIKSDNLVLHFSKPIDNILAVELTDFDLKLTNGIKFGKGFRILFLFNEKGLIENYFWKTFIYN